MSSALVNTLRINISQYLLPVGVPLTPGRVANGVDPDQTPRSEQGLHCLLRLILVIKVTLFECSTILSIQNINLFSSVGIMHLTCR